MGTARLGLAVATSSSDGRTYAIGGFNGTFFSTTEAYNPNTNTWTTLASMTTARTALAAAASGGKIYAIGGVDKNGAVLKTVEAYTIASGTWSTVSPMLTARYGLAAATGTDGRIYAIGGFDNITTFSTVEVYTPGTDTWSTVANSMPTPRFDLAATTGADGRIYAIGGFDGANYFTTVEAYNTTTGIWSAVASLATGRIELAAATGADHQIYAMGGFDSSANTLSSVEAYNPSTQSWLPALPMPVGRHQLAAAAGPNNRIYAIGGQDPNGNVLSSVDALTVTVNGPAVTPPADQSGTEGAANSFNLGSFNDSNASATSFSVDVNWGDGTAHTSFSTGSQGGLGTRPHTYPEEGTYTVTVRVTDNASVSGSGTFMVTVSDPAVAAAPVNFTVGAGTTFSNQAVATFTDPGGPEANDGTHYAAVIDWGDGSAATSATISVSGTTYTVRGSHNYAQAGQYTTTVLISHENAAQVGVQGLVDVGSTTVAITAPPDQSTTEGASTSVNLGSFSDSNSSATSWSVDVDWGDGTAHTTFSLTSQGSLGSRTHTYGEEGLNTVTVVVTSNTGAGGSVTFKVAVSDPAVIATAVNFSAVPGTAFTGQAVATFTDPGGAEPNPADPVGTISNHYTATIDWGDGTPTTTAVITISGGIFTVSGDHTYAQAGLYNTSVAITHEASSLTTAQGHANVGTSTVAITAPVNQTATEGASASLPLGSFTDSNASATSWTADVNWGDGSAHTTFTLISQGSLGSRSHIYVEEGTYTVTVTVTNNLSGSNSATYLVVVSDPAVVATAVNFSAVPGTAFSNQAVATFTDPGGPEPNPADPNGTISNHYTATISWGDGSAATAGAITINGAVFTVSGGHTYAQAGTFQVTVVITHESSAPVTVNGTATISSTTSGQVNFVDFETGDFSQTATHVGGAIVSNPALDGHFSLQLLRSNSVANAEIRQSGTTYYNLPTVYYSFLFQFASQTGEGGVVNFQDTASGYKAALHLSAAGKLLFYDSTGNLAGMGTTTLNPNQTYTLSAKIGTGMNGAWEIRINGIVEMSGTANLGPNNNGSVKLGGGSPYTTNYYYDDVAINSQTYPGTALVVTAPANQTATAGASASVNLGTFSDTTAGATSWTVDVNWGDGSPHTTFPTTTTGSLGSKPHTYAVAGTNTVTVTVTDNLSVSGSATFQDVVAQANPGQVNRVDFETGDFSQTASHVGGAIVTSPALDGTFSLQLLRNNTVANAEIRQSGMTYYNLPTVFYSFLFQFASQTGEGGVVNFQDTASGYKAALHLSAAGKLLFYDSNGNLVGTGATTLNPNQTYTLSAKIGTGPTAVWEIRINGIVEMSGTANLGPNNNGSIKLGGGSPYTTNYYYDDVAINSQNYPSSPAPPGGSSAPMLVSQNQAIAPVGTVQVSATGRTLPEAQLVPLSDQPLPLRLAGQDTPTWPVVNHGQTATALVDSFFADWGNDLA